MRSWAVFDSPVQDALHAIKYRRNIGLADAIAVDLAEFAHSLNWRAEVLIPIPLGKARLQERGYNQVALVARPLAYELGILYAPHGVRKIRETRSQVGLTAAERRENVRAAYQADPSAVKRKSILLMDDVATTSGGLLFNLSTNSNYELLADRLSAATQDPALIGGLLASIYAVAALAQVIVGRLIDRYSLKALYLSLIAMQGVLIAAATQVSGWAFVPLQLLFMAMIFGAIPFTDAMIVRFVDDRLRSRVAGMRLAVSLGASSVAVWMIGPIVKQSGFGTLLGLMAAVSVVSFLVVTQLPSVPAPVRQPA